MSAWLVQTLIATSLLMLVVLAVRPFVRRLFGAGAAYALWLVPALRFVLPPIAVPQVAKPLVPSGVEIVMAAGPADPASSAWLLAAWATGALLFAGWHLIAYRRFLFRALRNADVRSVPGAFATDAVQGPAAVGLLVRRVLVPHDFVLRFSAEQRDLALHHEHVHHARGDLWANAAALGMLALHWFNPIAHLAYLAFREDQELSCDAAVIAEAGAEQRAAYGEAMVKSAWGAAPVTTCTMTRSCNLKRRLKMVKTHRKSAFASAAGMASTFALAIGGLTLTATGASATDPVVKVQTIRIKREAGTDPAVALSEVLNSNCGALANRSEVATTMGADGKPTQIFLCGKDGAPVDKVVALQKARDGIAGSSNLDAAQRTKVLGTIDEALAKARAR